MLNAFRHHRGGHPADVEGETAEVIECSTPFGITEVGIRTGVVERQRRARCSTPFGITEVGIARSPSRTTGA